MFTTIWTSWRTTGRLIPLGDHWHLLGILHLTFCLQNNGKPTETLPHVAYNLGALTKPDPNCKLGNPMNPNLHFAFVQMQTAESAEYKWEEIHFGNMSMTTPRLPCFWAKLCNACYTQNRSLIHTLHNKSPYELVHDKKPDLSFLRIFGALCYPTNDNEDLRKLKAKADIGFFVGYAPNRKGYRIYNKHTRQVIETIHVTFDELTEQTAHVHSSPGPTPILLTLGPISLVLVPNPPPAAPYVPPTNKDLEILF
ncbi:retrovirus-related pol polyprotein from transposon TNT 1-94 [Tanacetum coccineum]